MAFAENPVTRVVSRLAIGGPKECWEYQGARTRGGYGELRCAGTMGYAHRVMAAARYGPLAPGQVVRHTCDNPACCNPEHLVLGSMADNNADMWERGRGVSGRSRRRLTASDVVAIREARAAGASVIELAERHGISESHTIMVVNGTRWPNAGGPITRTRSGDLVEVER